MKAVKYLKLFVLYFVIIMMIAIGQRYIERARFFSYNNSYEISDCSVEYLQDYARRYFADGTVLSDYVFHNDSYGIRFCNSCAISRFNEFDKLFYCDEDGYVKGYLEPLIAVNGSGWSTNNGYLLFDFTKFKSIKWIRPYMQSYLPVFAIRESDMADFGCYRDSVTKELVEHVVIADDGHGGYVLQPDTFVKGSHEFKIF